MPATDAARADTADRFQSLAATLAHHRARLPQPREPADPRAFRGRIIAFLEKGRNTGTLLDDLNGRGAAQSLLDYWVATLYTLPEGGLDSLPMAAESAILDDFDAQEAEGLVR